MDLNDKITITLSILAFIFSLMTWLLNGWIARPYLKIKVMGYGDNRGIKIEVKNYGSRVAEGLRVFSQGFTTENINNNCMCVPINATDYNLYISLAPGETTIIPIELIKQNGYVAQGNFTNDHIQINCQYEDDYFMFINKLIPGLRNKMNSCLFVGAFFETDPNVCRSPLEPIRSDQIAQYNQLRAEATLPLIDQKTGLIASKFLRIKCWCGCD